LGFKSGDRILVPDFICEALIHPLSQLGIIPVYFPVNDQFEPLWGLLSELANRTQCKAIIMVHYFGQPQDIVQFQQFCNTNNLLLIEDNAHGFGGLYKGRLLGTFGDIGIVSPRKLLKTKYGGQLYISGVLQPVPYNMQKNKSQMAYWAFKNLALQCPTFTNSVFSFLGQIPNFCDAASYNEPEVKDRTTDCFSSWIIRRNFHVRRMNLTAKKRRHCWQLINNIVSELGGVHVFPQVSEQSSPWAFPFYTKSGKQREKIRSHLLSKGYNIFPWPALPAEVLLNRSYEDAVDRWHRLLCVSL
jgi:dTDP-4-amino-4,6-dideoxygalactose transaminase